MNHEPATLIEVIKTLGVSYDFQVYVVDDDTELTFIDARAGELPQLLTEPRYRRYAGKLIPRVKIFSDYAIIWLHDGRD